MASTVEVASVAPGICTRMELAPCCWTVASEAPRAFTRLWTMDVAVCMSSLVGWVPSDLEAERMTETPPWMSRPWVIFSPTGVKATAHAAQSASITTSAPTCPRAADERPPFPRPRLLGLEPLALVSLAASRHRSTPVLGASDLES